MKTLIIAFAALAAFASAATARPTQGPRLYHDVRAADAQAMVPNYSGTVIGYGRTLGTDPDPQVRLQLLRNAGFNDR